MLRLIMTAIVYLILMLASFAYLSAAGIPWQGGNTISGSKRKRLDFLGFLWPNRDFSMGYRESK
jgi:hypothetical protein